MQEEKEALSSDEISLFSESIYYAFIQYNENFLRITKKAVERFENRDKSGAQKDLIERIQLYDRAVTKARCAINEITEINVGKLSNWQYVKEHFWERINGTQNEEFAKTFFNSVHRDTLRHLNLNPAEVSDTTNVVATNSTPFQNETDEKKVFIVWRNIKSCLQEIFQHFSFKSDYRDIESLYEVIEKKILNEVNQVNLIRESILRIEILDGFFFQSNRAFLVGKVITVEDYLPVAFVFANTNEGVILEGILSNTEELSMLFGYSRSYFMVDIEPIEGAVNFIESILPEKPRDEIYTILGRSRQGKTERARILYQHLESTAEQFCHARGIPGLVMIVFSLPSHGLVFKVIRDSFGFSKETNAKEVKEKYSLVFNHDRAGRLIDTQEFRNTEFPLSRFEPTLLEELVEKAAKTVKISGDKVIIEHLYTERKVVPLDIYLKENPREKSLSAMMDYGQAIKDLALTNIFPGDLLLKNFGVSTKGRVIFYDYDELCLVTDCIFRDVPDSDNIEDEIRADNWFHVNKDDVFPETFRKFIPMDTEMRAIFEQKHGAIFEPDFWRKMKNLHLSGELPDVPPRYRFQKKKGQPIGFKS